MATLRLGVFPRTHNTRVLWSAFVLLESIDRCETDRGTVETAGSTVRILLPICIRSARSVNSRVRHESFKNFCISLAQWSHRTEVRLRTGLLGENPKNIRPLSEARQVIGVFVSFLPKRV